MVLDRFLKIVMNSRVFWQHQQIHQSGPLPLKQLQNFINTVSWSSELKEAFVGLVLSNETNPGDNLMFERGNYFPKEAGNQNTRSGPTDSLWGRSSSGTFVLLGAVTGSDDGLLSAPFEARHSWKWKCFLAWIFSVGESRFKKDLSKCVPRLMKL